MKDKQIKEMPMCSHCKNSCNCKSRETVERLEQLGGAIGCSGYEHQKPSTMEDIEKELMANRGYYKASEVAREIFEEIESIVDKRTSFNGNIYSLLIKRDFAELKKKYTENKGE